MRALGLIAVQQARRRLRRAYRLAENDHLPEAIRMAVQAKDGFLTATRGNRRWMDEYAAFLIAVSDLRLAQVDLRAANDDLDELVKLYEADGNEPVDDERVDQLADALTRRGNCLRLRADYPRADIDLARARQLARSPLALARAHNASGILAKDRGRLDDAGEHYVIALNTLVKLFGEDDSRLADVQHNLAGLQHARRAYTEGEQFARRAITLRTKAHGADSIEVAADMAVLGALLLGHQRFDEAEHLFEQTCDCWTRHRGPEHYEVAIGLHSLGAVHVAQGQHRKATHDYAEALRIKRTVLGDTHPEVLSLTADVAELARRGE